MDLWNTIGQAEQELVKNGSNTIVTIGNFDGVHRGHQAIISRVKELADLTGSLAVVFTFVNHTASYLGEKPLLLNQPLIRRELLARKELDALLEVEFTRDFAALEPEVFFEKWLINGLRAKVLVVGHDFRFGAGGKGDPFLLQKLGMARSSEQLIIVEQALPVAERGEIISSSRIRQLISEGNIRLANQMLGYPFQITGVVVKGEQRGRNLGYPTANIHLEPEYQLPGFGVYLVCFRLEEGMRGEAPKAYYGVASVGVKPTFGTYKPIIEVYLFDVSINLYERAVRVEFLQFIRPERRFKDATSLKEQIAKDVAIAKENLNDFIVG